jgi:dipeptidase D
MDKNIQKLEPKQLWSYFYSLTQIPRPSKHEQKVIEFVKKFGHDLGLETIVDEVGNVMIRKPATKGMENRFGVVLQSHLDMVPQNNSDKVHDFEKDPIEAYIDGEWVTANGTTLGSDNGIGASAAMSVLASKDLEHGPVEALFTIDEETGMTGAFGLKGGILKGDILLNLDSEDEGELYIGCAGGINASVLFNYTEEKAKENHQAFKIVIKGLKGGHSGLDINLKRGNANKMMNKILFHAEEYHGLMLSSIEGGNMRNAIPREASAIVAIPAKEKEALIKLVKDNEAEFKKSLTDDPDFSISIESIPLPDKFIDAKTAKDLIKSMYTCPNGVVSMSKKIAGIVETSTNMAIIKSDNGKIELLFLLRSSVEEAKSALCDEFKTLFGKYHAKIDFSGDYPGWAPNPDSAILNTMKQVYLKNFGKTPEVKVIHAGLECGILGAVYPNWDMISFGPTIRHPHSPDEKVHIKSVGKFWEYLIQTLKNIPVRQEKQNA